jgi:hypothetical protein
MKRGVDFPIHEFRCGVSLPQSPQFQFHAIDRRWCVPREAAADRSSMGDLAGGDRPLSGGGTPPQFCRPASRTLAEATSASYRAHGGLLPPANGLVGGGSTAVVPTS